MIVCIVLMVVQAIKKTKKSYKDTGLVSLDHRREKDQMVLVDEHKNAVMTAKFADVLHYEYVLIQAHWQLSYALNRIYEKANVFYFVVAGLQQGQIALHLFTAVRIFFSFLTLSCCKFVFVVCSKPAPSTTSPPSILPSTRRRTGVATDNSVRCHSSRTDGRGQVCPRARQRAWWPCGSYPANPTPMVLFSYARARQERTALVPIL